MALISSSQITEKFDISYQTLNFYTNLGLLIVRKRVGNRRLYDEEEIRSRIVKISEMKEDGYPLRMIVKELGRAQPDSNGSTDSNGLGKGGAS